MVVGLSVLLALGEEAAAFAQNENPASTANTVTITLKVPLPEVLATRVGKGSFAEITPRAGSLTIRLPAGTTDYSVAWVCPPAQIPYGPLTTYQFLVDASSQDLTSVAASCWSVSATAPVTGALKYEIDARELAGVTDLDLIISTGEGDYGFGISQLLATGTVQVPKGKYPVDVAAYTSKNSASSSTQFLDAVRSFTAQTVPGSLNDGVMVTLGVCRG
jgi:hypothetical protein